MKSLLLALLVVSSILVGNQLLAQPGNGAVERGGEVFQHWCAPCHASGPRHPGTAALEVLYKGAKPAALEERTDLIPELTRFFVRNGVSIMPPFRKTEISDEELEALAAYLAPKELESQ